MTGVPFNERDHRFRREGLIGHRAGSRPKLFRAAVLPVALLCGTHGAFAQQRGVVLKVESLNLEVDETVAVRLECTNIGVPSLPQAVVPDGLELTLLNSEPSASSFFSNVQGPRSRSTTYTFSMQLKALRVGTYTLGPVSVGADQVTHQSDPVRIVVREPTTAARGDRYIFAEIDVQPRSMYVSQFAEATLTIGIRKVRINGRAYEVDLLRKVLNQSRSEFSVFVDGDVRQSELQVADSQGVFHRYAVFHVTKRVRGEQVGALSIGPVFLKADYPTRLRRGFFGGYEVAEHRRETARTEAVLVEVQAAPDEGRPAEYTGAIGRFRMSVSAKPARVEQGKPVTLTISISGAPLDGLAGPDLRLQPELDSRFDYTKDELVGDTEGDAKVFRRAVFPRQLGEQTVPPIRWSYFDPGLRSYVTLNSDPITIVVDRSSASFGAVRLIENGPVAAEAASLTVLSGGISPNYIDAAEVLADQSFVLTGSWASTLAVGPLAWIAVVLSARHRSRLRSDVGYARRCRAGRKARRRIKQSVSNGRLSEPVHVIGEALTGYISDRFGLGEGALTPAEVHSLLASRGVNAALVLEIAEFLRSCDAARFAARTFDPDSGQDVASRALEWISKLERGTR